MRRYAGLALLLCSRLCAQQPPLPLVDFAAADLAPRLSLQTTAEVQASLVDGAAGKALEVRITPGTSGYPGLTIAAPGGAWNLAAYGRVQAKLTNLSATPVTLAVRIDNDGDWQQNPWNSENCTLAAGASGTCTITFGWSWGNRGYALDPAKVVRLLIFTTKPKEPVAFRIDSVAAIGQPGDKPAGQLDLRKPAGGQLVTGPTAVPAGGKGLSVTAPPGTLWDLSDAAQVAFVLHNPGPQPAQVTCRVDNRWANPTANSVGQQATVAAGAVQTVVVPFAPATPWNGNDKTTGSQFSSDTVAAVTVLSNQPLELRRATAQAGAPATVPAWVGQRPPVPGDWKLTFEDTFGGTAVDLAKWTLPAQEQASIWDANATEVAENASVTDGCLRLKCEVRSGPPASDPKLRSRKYRTTVVTTFDKFAQRYGYFEARLKLPTTLGLWPAFWMMPDRGPAAGEWWKRQDTKNGGMEIDILESLVRFGPFRTNIAAHWDGYQKDHKSLGTERIYYRPDAQGYVTSGLLWEPGKLSWYLNGELVGTWSNERVGSLPGYLLFTLPTGGWGTYGNIAAEKLPDTFDVDWVRVWQQGAWAAP